MSESTRVKSGKVSALVVIGVFAFFVTVAAAIAIMASFTRDTKSKGTLGYKAPRRLTSLITVKVLS